ncbi:hypothetical protein [uncultured Leuconostoc sp.]|uniref:hypothetical protein n=1 Tax=uncultured Leuconostoc sp. TaxID=173262 RepID=UPI0026011B29|nr:hypothetical protein [uncultured Leuconostoc sp.]
MINLHKYVKNQYESGVYSQYKAQTTQQANDYDLGRQQARQDVTNHQLRHYPSLLLRFGNFILRGRLVEITRFVQGYNDQKHVLQNK